MALGMRSGRDVTRNLFSVCAQMAGKANPRLEQSRAVGARDDGDRRCCGGAFPVTWGMLVVLLRGVNFGFLSLSGCSGQSYVAVKVSFRVACEEISKCVFAL